jgi:hypothetical protein
MVALLCITDHVPTVGEQDVRVELLLVDRIPDFTQTLGEQIYQQIWLYNVANKLENNPPTSGIPHVDTEIDDVIFIAIKRTVTGDKELFEGEEFLAPEQKQIFMESYNVRSNQTSN